MRIDLSDVILWKKEKRIFTPVIPIAESSVPPFSVVPQNEVSHIISADTSKTQQIYPRLNVLSEKRAFSL